jgi:SAM-dependent methyltransferase
MSITAPCYSRVDYWRYFDIDYSGLRVLDLGSSAGSYARREFGSARNRLANASVHVSVDVNASVRPAVVGDAQSLPFASESFDVILANNVIEHLREPDAGVAEMRRVLRPGGTILYTIPFLYPVHEAPHDYVRFTAHGLRQLFREFSEVDVQARGGWFSTVAQLVFLLTHGTDRVGIGGALRVVLYPFLWAFVQLDRLDTTQAFTRVYFGRLRK